MAMKNYYAILGVSQAETPAGIRAAYRDAARRTHPDHAGPRSAGDFQEVIEAHSVLSEPNRRRQYDENLDRYKWDRSRPRMLHWFVSDPEPPSIFENPYSAHPSLEALADRLLRNFTGWDVPKAEKPEALSVEVILSPEEAARGGLLSIGVPVYKRCLACNGSGMYSLFRCLYCRGDGLVSYAQPVQFRIPPALSLGLTPEVSLESLGINNLFLRLRLRVSDE